jgi:hypothetical protein
MSEHMVAIDPPNRTRQVGGTQVRTCANGHTWELKRMHNDDPKVLDKLPYVKDGKLATRGKGTLSFMQWTDGSLSCPECGGHAVSSENMSLPPKPIHVGVIE